MSGNICSMMTSSATAPRAVVAGHGDFAAGVISAVQKISGRGSLFLGISNASHSAASLETALGDALSSHGASVVFTDLPAGSCTVAARRVARRQPGLAVVTGANVSMLLDFAMRGAADTAGLEVSADRARAAIGVVPPQEVG